MAKDVVILNSSAKSFHYARAIGYGTPEEGDLLSNNRKFLLGSVYVDKLTSTIWVRMSECSDFTDWSGFKSTNTKWILHNGYVDDSGIWMDKENWKDNSDE